MGFLNFSVLVELLLQERIHRRVETKWRTRWLRHTKATIKVETAPTLHKEFQLSSAKLKGLTGIRFKLVSCSYTFQNCSIFLITKV